MSTERPTEVAGYVLAHRSILDDPAQIDALCFELDATLDDAAARDAPGSTVIERRYEDAYLEPEISVMIRQSAENELAAREGREPLTVHPLAYRWARASLSWPDQ